MMRQSKLSDPRKIQKELLSQSSNKWQGNNGKKMDFVQRKYFCKCIFELKKSMPNFKEFSLINPLIIRKTLNEYSALQVKIKWPNDLLIKNRKVCGILQELVQVERKFFLIIGIGINTVTAPKTKTFKGTSLLESSNKLIDNSKILKKV